MKEKIINDDYEEIKKNLEIVNVSFKEAKEKVILFHEITKKCADKGKIKCGNNLIERMDNCRNIMIFDFDRKFEKKKLVKTRRCGDRFCPACQVTDARLLALKILTVSKWINIVKKKSLIFVTLTVPNCQGDELRNTLDILNKAYAHMTRLKKMKCIKGSYRKIEITYNITRDDYHPHLHLMIAVNKSYFKSKEYVSHDEWKGLWQQSLENVMKKELDKEPYVNVERICDEGAAFEIAKYCAKPCADFYTNEDVYSTIRNAVYKKKLNFPKGIFIEGFELFENGELDYLMQREDVDWVHRIRFEWMKEKNDYATTELNIDDEVTNEEMSFLLGQPIYGKRVSYDEENDKK